TMRSARSKTWRILCEIRINGSPFCLRLQMMFSTWAVSWTPSAAVGSSMMMSFEAKVAVRAIATHWRCPPDMLRMVFDRLGILTAVFSRALRVASRICRKSRIEKGPSLSKNFSRPRKRLDGTSRSSAKARFWNTVSMPASRASMGLLKLTSWPWKMIPPEVGLFARRDLSHEGRFARAVVAHDGDMFAPLELEIGPLQRMHAAIVLGETLGLENAIGHVPPPIARALCAFAAIDRERP